MRSVTFVITQAGGFHPANQVLAEEAALTRENVFQLNILDDWTAVLLVRIRGDLDRARELIAERSDVLGYSVSGEREGEAIAYIHTQPPKPLAEFIQLPRKHEVVFDFPLERTRDGGIRVTMIGETNGVLQRALADVPDVIDVTVERIGAYPSDMSDVAAVLTERQQEILSAAVELGYYESPRQATHSDIAERIGLSAGTVSEHLQKIESRVFTKLVTHPLFRSP